MRYEQVLDVYAYGDVYQTITYLDKPSSNRKYVTIKQSRTCASCGITIPKGSHSLTTNGYRQPRAWHCKRCSWSILPTEGREKVWRIIDGEMVGVIVSKNPTVYLPMSLYHDFDQDDYEEQTIQAIDIYQGEF